MTCGVTAATLRDSRTSTKYRLVPKLIDPAGKLLTVQRGVVAPVQAFTRQRTAAMALDGELSK